MPRRAIKDQLTCPLEITSGSFLIGRRRILVISRNHLVMHSRFPFPFSPDAECVDAACPDHLLLSNYDDVMMRK